MDTVSDQILSGVLIKLSLLDACHCTNCDFRTAICNDSS
jgi:hypothetical protein